MTLLGKHSIPDLRRMHEEAVQRSTEPEEMRAKFGKQPYYFLDHTSPSPPYAHFYPMWTDEDGRQYTQVDENLLGIRITINKRKLQPSIDFPPENTILELSSLRGGERVRINLESVWVGDTRRATAAAVVKWL